MPLLRQARRRYRRRQCCAVGLLTPIAKSWPSEFGLAANDIAIQIHGGYGYTRDFDVEQLWRDNRLNAIHEGTTTIQGIDLLGRKILRDGTALPILRQRILATTEAAAGRSSLAGLGPALTTAWDRIDATLARLARLAEAKDGQEFDNATLFLRAFGHVVVAWLWLDQAVAADRLSDCQEEMLASSKLTTCRFYFESELPKTEALLAEVASLSDVAAKADPSIFA